MSPAEVKRLERAAPTSLDQVPAEPWETPTPLTAVETVPTFPLDTLPEPTRSLVQMTADSFDMSDPALVGVLTFPVVSTLTAGRWVVEERPGYREPLQMFTASVGSPSVGKTPSMRVMAAPLYDIERELYDAHTVDRALAESRRRVDEKRREELERRLAKDSTDHDAARELDDLVRALAKPLPAVPRLVTTDGTAEVLSILMQENGGRIAQIDDEPGVLGMMTGRYAGNNRATPNLDPWTKGYSGSVLSIDRVGRPWVRIEQPALTLGVSVQPSILLEAGRNLAKNGQGVLARFLYAWPSLGVWDRSRVSPPVPEQLRTRYAEQLRELHRVSTTVDPGAPRVLTVDPDALVVLRAWMSERARLEEEAPEGTPLREWLGKLDGQTLRMAGNLALLADPHATSVNLEHTRAAVKLARDYFTPHARRVFGELVQTDDYRRAGICLDAIRKGAQRAPKDGWERWPHQVKAAEVRELVRGNRTLELDKSSTVDEALAVLVDRDYLRPAPVAEGDRGRKVHWYDVNPAAFDLEPAVPAPTVERAEPEPVNRDDLPDIF